MISKDIVEFFGRRIVGEYASVRADKERTHAFVKTVIIAYGARGVASGVVLLGGYKAVEPHYFSEQIF